MRARSWIVGIVIAGTVACAIALAISRESSPTTPVTAAPLAATPSSADVLSADIGAADETAAPAMPEHVTWIAVGGGSEPELNQVSLEDDLLLAREVLGNDGIVLFAGGPGTRAVQVRDDGERGEPLRRVLGDVLSPRGGRDARYLPTRVAPHGPATLDGALDALRAALAEGGEPLLFWVATHGDRGEQPADAVALLWGGGELDAAALERTIRASESARQVRLVITSCYSGGFAEIAFDGLDPARGATSLDVCGLFATSWDEEASGCDPSPDRAAHEGYSIHLLEALRGRDREGHDIRAQIDLDGDATISLLEAHARARVAAISFDLPTTTSSRLLRGLTHDLRGEAIADVSLPEEEIVVSAIGARLRITDASDAQARLDAITARRVELEAASDEASELSRDAWWALAGQLLSRWPAIDDPWHPDFEATLAAEGRSIEAFLDASPDYARWLDAQDDVGAMEQTLGAMRVEAAPLRRWLEARETIALARRLRAVGGEGWARYERMRACEQGAP